MVALAELTIRNRLSVVIRKTLEVVTRSMEIVSTQGFGSFLRQVKQKTEKREFRLLEPGTGISCSVPAMASSHVISTSKFGVNFAGFFTGQFGLGASARAIASALNQANVPIILNKMIDADQAERQTFAFDSFSDRNPYRINIIHLNADQSKPFFTRVCPNYSNEKYNIGIWYWELPDFPKRWQDAFQFYDELWVSSSFIAKTLLKSSNVPVIKIRYPLSVPKNIERQPARNKHSFKDQFVFLFVFDFYSILERKNPLGLLRAFQQAFNRNENALLVLNAINGSSHPNDLHILRKMSEDLNVLLIEDRLTPVDYYSLFSAADCYVSLHRAEGLGLPMAEAMSLGKPVIATGYSGNTDFMNHNNSLLVKFDLVRLEKTFGNYDKGNFWANPDVDHAAQLMRWVYEHRDEAEDIGRRARIEISQILNPELAGREMKERLQLIFSKMIK